MLNLQAKLIALLIGVITGLAGGWYLTARYKDATWSSAMASQQTEAAARLQLATEHVLAIEREKADQATKLEMRNAQKRKQLDGVLADNRRLVRELNGLRDPGLRTRCDDAMSAAASASGVIDAASAGARLSDEASEFLLEFARLGDEAASYAQTCYAWIVERAPGVEISLTPTLKGATP